MDLDALGKWAFLIGIVIAVIAGFLTSQLAGYETWILAILAVLGIIVGLLNVTEKDMVKFMVATIALAGAAATTLGALSLLDVVITYVTGVLGNFIIFVSAVAFVVSIKAIIETSKQ